MTTVPTHAQALGARLRRIRHQQGLSLADVEHQSNGEWKAVVVGAYERGDRAVSMDRLSRLATFYGVPVSGLLPSSRLPDDERDGTVVLDLTRLGVDELEPVARFAASISQVRGDHNGRLLTLRGGDLDTLALAVGRDAGELRTTLDRHGVLLPTGRVAS